MLTNFSRRIWICVLLIRSFRFSMIDKRVVRQNFRQQMEAGFVATNLAHAVVILRTEHVADPKKSSLREGFVVCVCDRFEIDLQRRHRHFLPQVAVVGRHDDNGEPFFPW